MNTCHSCGHQHLTMANATIGQGERSVSRHYCHENDHSCYQDHQGHYFDDVDWWMNRFQKRPWWKYWGLDL